MTIHFSINQPHTGTPETVVFEQFYGEVATYREPRNYDSTSSNRAAGQAGRRSNVSVHHTSGALGGVGDDLGFVYREYLTIIHNNLALNDGGLYVRSVSRVDEVAIILGGMIWALTWIAATALIWREIKAERLARLRQIGAIACPTCGYNLTGLREAKCPECGSQFTLDQLYASLGGRPADLSSHCRSEEVPLHLHGGHDPNL